MIPLYIKNSLVLYVKTRRPTGGFLRSVLENNLSEAIIKADASSLANIKEIVLYILTDMPTPCWGSDKKVEEWLACTDQKEIKKYETFK